MRRSLSFLVVVALATHVGFSAAAVEDFFQVLTRSDGTPDSAFGETLNGVEFQSDGLTAFGNVGEVVIGVRDDGASLMRVGTAPNKLANFATSPFHFVITDDGFNVTLELTEVADPTNSAFVASAVSTSFLSDLVTFHNRERVGSTDLLAFLDDVKIESLTTGAVLLEDDFEDGFLDPTKWSVVTSIPQGGASVTEANGRIELRNRGYLNTAQEYDPLDPSVGGLRITGTWSFGDASVPEPGAPALLVVGLLAVIALRNGPLLARLRVSGQWTRR